MTNFVVVTIFVVVIGAFAWAVRKGGQIQRRLDAERRALARRSGWAYAGERDGDVDYRFTGDDGGVAWQMWHDSDRGDRSPTPEAYWHSDNLHAPQLSLVIIGRRRYEMESGAVGRVVIGVVAGVAEALTGVEGRMHKAGFYESAVEASGLPAAFRERFAVALAPDMPRDWIDESLQSLLLRWPAGGAARFASDDAVEVTLNERGLRITVRRMPQDAACWKHLAQLGEHLAQRLARSDSARHGG